MLQAIRSRTASWVMRLLFVVLAASFGMYWIVDYIRPQAASEAVVTIGDEKLTRADLNQAFSREMRRMKESFNIDMTPEIARETGFYRNVIDETIQTRLVQLEARRLGVVSPQDAVVELIHRADAFKGRDGAFDPNRFTQYLNRRGTTEARLISEIAADWQRGQLMRGLSGFPATRGAAERLARYRGEQRVADIFTVTWTAQPEPPAPDDAALQAFADQQRARFQTPERRGFSLLVYRPEDLAGEVQIKDSEIEAAYTQRLEDLSSPETRTVDQVLLDSAAKAEALSAAVKAGATLAEAAGKVDGAALVPLGSVTRKDLPDDLAGPVFSLAVGEVSGAVQSAFGWHVFVITAAQAGKVPTLAEASPRLKEDLIADRAADLLFERVNRLEDAIAAGATLDQVAIEAKIAAKSYPPLDKAGRDTTGAAVAGLPVPQQLLGVLFGLEAGKSSNLIEMQGQRGYFMVRLDKIEAPSLPPLAMIRDLLTTAWVQAQREAAAATQAAALINRLDKGEALPAVAEAIGAVVTRTAPFTRTGEGAEIPAALAADLFKRKPGGAAHAPLPSGDTMVGQLVEIRPLSGEALVTQSTALRNELRSLVDDDVQQQFINALRARHKVSIDEKAVSQF